MPIPKNLPVEMPKTARERVYNELRKWIIDGTLKPGEKISDQEISQYFSVSRTPVREAIQLLADQKLVNIYPGRETCVAPLDLEHATSFYKIMAELHVLALDFAYTKITPEVLDTLREINGQFAAAYTRHDISDANTCDQAFHGVFFDLSDNYFLKEFEKTLGSHIQRFETIYYGIEGEFSNSIQSHDQIINALARHDLAAAKTHLRENWLNTMKFIEKSKTECTDFF